MQFGPPQCPPQLVLCFDGTRNTFKADGSETNVLKIFRMLDRSNLYQISYYQPGIGTDITPGSLAASALRRERPWSSKTLDSALGGSFKQHLIGGYRVLMKHYPPDAQIYIFGFSRGAYTASFLNDMIDYVGVIGSDNEELVPFIWEAFATWKFSHESEQAERKAAYKFMKVARETACRPISQVKFLGLFDMVNSIEEMKSSSNLHPGAKVIRHAVSIDERRVKFLQVLLGPSLDRYRAGKTRHTLLGPTLNRYHAPNWPSSPARPSLAVPMPSSSTESLGCGSISSGLSILVPTAEDHEQEEEHQDMQEVWFPGCHSDIGGGWKRSQGERWRLSHTPLVWMVQEAERAGLMMDKRKAKKFECLEEFNDSYSPYDSPDDEPVDDMRPTNIHDRPVGERSSSSRAFHEALQSSAAKGVIHDRLEFGQGFAVSSVVAWRLMEYLPLSRMALQQDSSWKRVQWPPHRGAARDIPRGSDIHTSAIQRIKSDPTYRPLNLIIDNKKRALGTNIRDWVVKSYEGDPVREIYVQRRSTDTMSSE